MKKKRLTALTEATDAKLRYSQLYLDAIKNPEIAGSDEEKAHQASFVFHLTGVLDALLAEVNERFELGIKEKHLSLDSLRSVEIDSKKATKELRKLAKSLGKKSWMEEVRSFKLDRPLNAKKEKKENDEHETAVLIGEASPIVEDRLLAKFEEWQAKMRTAVYDLRVSAPQETEKSSKKGKK